MKRITLLIFGILLTFELSYGQTNPFDRISFIIGEWDGTGSGFGNEKSKIESGFQLVMDGKYVEVKVGYITGSHEREWIRAYKESPESRVECTSNFSYSGPFYEMVLLGVCRKCLSEKPDPDSNRFIFLKSD